MKRAVFLDRDGVINKEVDVLKNVKDLKILLHVASAVKAMNRLGFLVIIITNQPVVARGWLNEKQLNEIHAVLLYRLGKQGARIDAIYYCPHHPDANLAKYRIGCYCRKPNTGMIKTATADFDIDLKKSFMIGDSTRDILAGRRAGLKTILVKTGYGGKDGKYDVKPDFIAKNLLAAVKIIKKCKTK